MNRRTFLSTPLAAFAQPSRRPNILFILMDDMAQRALSCYGNPHVKTENLDRLAGEGVKFTDAYVTPQCTPTRATILTGQYTARNRMWHVIPGYWTRRGRLREVEPLLSLSRDTFTLAKGLREAGYATACMGKWHLTVGPDGDYTGLRPEASHHYGFDKTAGVQPKGAHQTGDKDVNRLTDEALRFIESNRARPWFLYLAHHSIHGPVVAPDEVVKKYRDKGAPEKGLHNATYLAALEHMDTAIGRLLKGVDALGLRDSTAVFFTTDNGGLFQNFDIVDKKRLRLRTTEFASDPLRFGKGSSYEGGIRVPLIVRLPGAMDAGTVCSVPVHGVDFMPTFFALAGAKVPAGHVADGVNILPLLRRRGRIADRSLYWYMPFYEYRWAHTPSAVVRTGDWKLIEFFGDYMEPKDGAEYTVGARIELFNLREDIGEKRNLAAQQPERVRKMRADLHRWIKNCGQVIPSENPDYDPENPLAESRT